jgi:TRAP-type C4-dicarboxylate transport system substrate-binding protein
VASSIGVAAAVARALVITRDVVRITSFNLPFLFRNTAHMQKVIDGPIGQELLGKVTSNQKAGLVGICWMDAGARPSE